MASVLKSDFIERKCHASRTLPSAWRLQDSQGQYYELDLKMCQLKSLEYDFKWGTER